MKKYWFKPKRYGYGFYPITWEGWVATMILVALLLISAQVNHFFQPVITTKDGLLFLLYILFLSALFTILFKDRVEGGLQWRWGKKKMNIEEKQEGNLAKEKEK